MTSSLYLNVIVAYVQYIYIISFQINISIQEVISMSDMVLWSVQMNRSLCMSKHIWHYVSENANVRICV